MESSRMTVEALCLWTGPGPTVFAHRQSSILTIAIALVKRTASANPPQSHNQKAHRRVEVSPLEKKEAQKSYTGKRISINSYLLMLLRRCKTSLHFSVHTRVTGDGTIVTGKTSNRNAPCAAVLAASAIDTVIPFLQIIYIGQRTPYLLHRSRRCSRFLLRMYST